MKLGAGNCALFLSFRRPASDGSVTAASSSDEAMRHAVCSNHSQNLFRAKHAGDPVVVLSPVPVVGRPFSLFMKSSLRKGSETLLTLDFEYCSGYVASPIEDEGENDVELLHHETVHALRDTNKAYVVDNFQRSRRKPMGQLYRILDDWREKSAAAPAANRVERGGDQASPPSLLARARALGYHPAISDHDLAKIIVNHHVLDRNFKVRFLNYDREIYDLVKAGESTRSIRGGARERDGNGVFLDPPLLVKDRYELCGAHV
jgi:hypothetical protein